MPRRPLTTNQAAEMLGMQPSTFRSAMTRARAGGLDLRLPAEQWLYKSIPLWDAARLKAWAESRPGSGRWGPRAGSGSGA